MPSFFCETGRRQEKIGCALIWNGRDAALRRPRPRAAAGKFSVMAEVLHFPLRR
jgi:hypothetical protein